MNEMKNKKQNTKQSRGKRERKNRCTEEEDRKNATIEITAAGSLKMSLIKLVVNVHFVAFATP